MASMNSMLGFDPYHQILANVRFFSPEHAYVRIITAREPSGYNFRVAVVREVDMGRHREVVLSESDPSVHMALRVLHVRSAEAVHNHIAMYGFDFPPDPKKQHGDDAWGSDEEAASGFSVGESTVAFSGVISNDGFSDEDVAVEFEDDEAKDAEAVGKIETLVSQMAIAQDEKPEPKSPPKSCFPEPKLTPASPMAPAANSSRRKAHKIRGSRRRCHYPRSRSRSKSSAVRRPLRVRSAVPEIPPPPPPPPAVEAGSCVDGTAALQQYHHQLRALDQLGKLPVLAGGNSSVVATNAPCINARPINNERQTWGEYISHIPTQPTSSQPAMMHAHAQMRARADAPPPTLPAPFIPWQRPPQPMPTPPLPPPPRLLPNLTPRRQQQPDPQPALHDIFLHITWAGGRGTVQVLERCAPSRRAIVDAALAYARSNPAAFTELRPRRRWDGHWGSDWNKAIKGALKTATFVHRKDGAEGGDESYDMTTYLGEDLSRLFDAAGTGAPLRFVVELSVGAYAPGPFVALPPAPSSMPLPLPMPDPRVKGGSGPAVVTSYRDLASDDEEIVDD